MIKRHEITKQEEKVHREETDIKIAEKEKRKQKEVRWHKG